MKRLFALVLTLILVVFIGVVAEAQTINNEVRVSAGVHDVEDVTVFHGRAELRKKLSERFAFNDVGSITTDGDTNLFHNAALIRFAPVEHVFVAGGIGVGKLTDADTFVNPTAQLGANFSFSRVNFEPFVQLETPDLASDNNVRSLSANLNVKIAVTESFGFIGTGQLKSSRTDNRFFNERFAALEKTATGGVYFSF